MHGNCLTYALGMYFAEGCTGRIQPAIVRAGRVPKLRFYYVNARGEKTYAYPLHPKAGLAACWHALWFEMQVRKGS